jgi:hypothetical protein
MSLSSFSHNVTSFSSGRAFHSRNYLLLLVAYFEYLVLCCQQYKYSLFLNPGKIGLGELYNLDSVFEIVRQMKYCRAVPEVVKSKETLAYLKDFISKVVDENTLNILFCVVNSTSILCFTFI